MGADIQQARWIDRLRRAGGTKGPAQMPLDDSLYGMIQVDDLSTTPYKWLSRGFVCIAPFDVTAAAGQFATVGLNFSNIPRTSYLCWIREICLAPSVPCTVNAARNGTGFGAVTGVNLFSRDSRADFPTLNAFLAGLVSPFVVSAAAQFGAAELCARLPFLGAAQPASPFIWQPDIVLADGQAFEFQSNTVAMRLAGYMSFEIIPTEPSELT